MDTAASTSARSAMRLIFTGTLSDNRSAPSGQEVSFRAFREFQRADQRLREVILQEFWLQSPPQKVRPQKFAEGRGVLGESAATAQFSGEAPIGIVLEIPDAPRNILVAAPLAALIKGMQPAAIVEIDPKRIPWQSPQIGHHGNPHLLHTLLV